jgi:hypothetical protein
VTETHIAGLPLRIANLLRQRCAYCGKILIDFAQPPPKAIFDPLTKKLDRVVIPFPEPIQPSQLCTIDADGQLVMVQHESGTNLPAGNCVLKDKRLKT